MFVNTKTKQIVEATDIIAENPNVSLPNTGWTDDLLAGIGYAKLNFPETLAPGPYEYLEEGVPVKEKDGKWYRSFTRKQVAADEKQVIETTQWHKVREERSQRLAECDWTQLPDAPVDQEAWASYRQQLRDITDNITDPFNVTWPNPPVTTQRT